MQGDTRANSLPRRSRRIHRRTPVSVVVKNQGLETTLTAATVNISAHGLCVQTRRGLECGQAVFVLPSREKTPTGYGRVVWATQAEAGLEFLN
jgi:hypothetical protein